MRKQESNQIIKRKERIISALLQDMVKWGEKERQETAHKEINRTVQLQAKNSVSFELGNSSLVFKLYLLLLNIVLVIFVKQPISFLFHELNQNKQIICTSKIN